MQNLYQPSKLLSHNEFHKLEKAFNQAWSKETTYPDIKDQWSEENKAYGQCAITALVIYDLFGGKIIYDKQNFHLWNELPDGTQQDLSRSQFKNKTTFRIYKYKTKDDILFDDNGKRTGIESRYKLLKQNLEKQLSK